MNESETDVVPASPMLKLRLDTLEMRVRQLQIEVAGESRGLVVSAADSLGIDPESPNWEYDRETNSFVRRHITLPDGRVVPADTAEPTGA